METLVLILTDLHNLMILVTFCLSSVAQVFTNLALQKSLQIVFNHSHNQSVWTFSVIAISLLRCEFE